MKKTLSMVFAAALAAAIFFGCSNSSSDNSALLLAMANNSGNSNIPGPDHTGLPANVGNNDFAGKTFKLTSSETTEKYAFGTDTVTWSYSNPSYGNTNIVYAYTYNATTKQLFMKVAGMDIQMYDYKFDSSSLKMGGSSRYPAGLGLNEIYNKYSFNYSSMTMKNGVTPVYILQKPASVQLLPNIVNLASTSGYRISSITADKINTSADATATGTQPNITWTYTDHAREFAYTKNDSESDSTKAVFDITGLDTNTLKLTVTYATADNAPTPSTTYTQE